ncbi:MAG: 6-bladed beta-propeller [Balneolaceae bacterium]|nr:6-bladed beta-propeller [Balneolaceae bacterium]
MRRIPKVIIAVVLLLISCAKEQRSEETSPAGGDLPIEIITEIGLADQPIEYQLGQPIAVRTDSAGNIYIADRASLTVKVFDGYGNYLRSFGGRGRGPGEFQHINFMEITDEGTLFFLDRGKLEYIYMNVQGEIIDTYTIPIASGRLQYYPHRVFWYEDKTIGIRRGGGLPTEYPPPFDRPLFHIFSRDFQEHYESFFPFRELGYTEEEHFIWNTFGYLPGCMDFPDSNPSIIYSPGVYNGMLYEFTLSNGQWEAARTLQGTPPYKGSYDIYTSEDMYFRNEGIPGVNRIYFSGGPFMGRLYSIDAGIYYLSDGRIVHFYGEWRGGDTTLEEGNTLDVSVQIFDEDGSVITQGYITSLQMDRRPSYTIINWKDDEDNFYLLNLPKDDIPTVIKFRLDL